jgi:hypothetical protein
MSLKHEQFTALLRTRELLFDLLDSKKCPKTRREMKERAYRCLKHFPFLDKDGEPLFSKY